MAAKRADARRNYAHILAVAEVEVAARGADASMEQIARAAGVGSATVRRHFPSQRELLEAVFRERLESLCAHAGELAGAPDAQGALLEWLRAVAAFLAAARGLAGALVQDHCVRDGAGACLTRLAGESTPLLGRAARAGTVAPEVSAADLLTLIAGIVVATERHPSPAAEADRLLCLAVRGIGPRS